MDDTVPEGQRFSQVYLRPTALLPDSARMRRRLALAVAEFDTGGLARRAAEELGVPIPFTGGFESRANWIAFLGSAELRDVLDLIREMTVHLGTSGGNPSRSSATATAWLDRVRRILAEESVRYRVDGRGGVHFTVDSEFERNRAATIGGLGAARYANVADLFDRAYRELDAVPPDGKAALRSVFQSVEGLFCLMTGATTLSSDQVERHLRPAVNRKFGGDDRARASSQLALTGLKNWIGACHLYRHEPGTEEPAQPPLALAILLISQGSGFIRWLIQIDQEGWLPGEASAQSER